MNIEQLAQVSPHAVKFPLIEAMIRYGINTPIRQAHFLAQVAHESAGFTATVENLNYSAKALRATFPKYFPDDSVANSYARQPEKIANKVYASRMGNGDEASGDGWRYRGRGLIQTTGKNNYSNFSARYYKDQRLIANPNPVGEPELAAMSAASFWHQNNINRYADLDDVKAVTKAVNGGEIGLADRKKHLAHIKTILGI